MGIPDRVDQRSKPVVPIFHDSSQVFSMIYIFDAHISVRKQNIPYLEYLPPLLWLVQLQAFRILSSCLQSLSSYQLHSISSSRNALCPFRLFLRLPTLPHKQKAHRHLSMRYPRLSMLPMVGSPTSRSTRWNDARFLVRYVHQISRPRQMRKLIGADLALHYAYKPLPQIRGLLDVRSC